MKITRNIAGIIIGLVFIFSGFVKAVDPLGTAYKFQEYFMAFHLNFLKWAALPLAILLFTAEFIAGFSVITGIRKKLGIWLVMLLMLIFTPVTFIVALNNPVTDCGCFGDAVHLTNWQTFLKNIFLISFALILFNNRREITTLFKPVIEWIIFSAIVLLITIFSFYNLRYLPVIDFLPYKKGVKIADKMVIPEGVKSDEYNTTFIYEKNGEKKEFDLTNYPADDTTWKFINQKSVLVKKGYQPPIHDFIITSKEGEDITWKVLSDTNYSMLMISKKLSDADKEHINEGLKLGSFCINHGINFYIITASVRDETENYISCLPFYFGDETTLKTMVRANPGYLLLKDGRIIDKWSWANVPGIEWFQKLTGNK
jgi:hypothetical protein